MKLTIYMNNGKTVEVFDVSKENYKSMKNSIAENAWFKVPARGFDALINPIAINYILIADEDHGCYNEHS